MVQVEACWVAAQIVDGPQLTGVALGRYFTVDPHQGLFTQHDVAEALWIVPQRMRPTDGFHRLATAVVGYAPNVTRLPYPGAPFSERFSGRITSVTADLFPGDVLVSRVSAKLSAKATADLRPLLNDLQSLRSAKNVDVVDGLAREIAALSTG